MAIKSGIFSVITGIVLILLLGNPPVGENLPDSQIAIASTRINGFFFWDLGKLSGTFKTAQIVSLLVFLAAVFVLGAIAGRARPLAAFFGGWGAAIGAAAIATIVYSLIVGSDGFYGGPGSDLLDRAYLAASDGAGVMVVLGWLFGIAVMLGSFGKNQPRVQPGAPGAYPPPPGPTWDPGPAAPPPSAVPPPAAPLPSPTPPPAAPVPPPAGPQIGPPPDRTQVYGQPPQQ